MKPVPEGFARDARRMGVSEAAAHYKSCTRTVRMWALECGDGLHEAMLSNGAYGSKLGGLKSGRLNGRFNVTYNPDSYITLTPEQEAMRFLQRKTRWVCYSSRIHTGESGSVYYHVGNRKLTRDGLFELARKYGFGDVEQR